MRDLKTEQFLDASNFNWEYRDNVPLKHINIKGAQQNPSRLTLNLDDDRVTRYARLMEEGTVFPAIVLLNDEDDKSPYRYDVATGLHRLKAIQSTRDSYPKETSAYLVQETEVYRREYLVRFLNTIEGRGTSVRDTALQAIEMYRNYPTMKKSLTSIANTLNIPPELILRLYKEEEVRRRAAKQGYDLSNIAQKPLLALQSIELDAVFAEVARYIKLYKPPSALIEELVGELKKVHDEEGKLLLISNYRRNSRKEQQGKKDFATIPSTEINKLMTDAKRVSRKIEGLGVTVSIYPLDDVRLSIAEDIFITLRKSADIMLAAVRKQKAIRQTG